MSNLYVGKIVSTHGIKGELKILSDFQFKDKVFVSGNELIVDGEIYVIKSYRHHKKFDLVTLNDYKDINEVLFLLKKKVYFDENKLILNSNEVLDEELITYKILTTEGKEGIIKEIFYASPENKIIRAFFSKEVLIPFNSPMIKKICKEQKEVLVELINGM